MAQPSARAITPLPRQLDAMRFIAKFQEAFGRAPRFVDIARGLGRRNQSSAHALVRGLIERGQLRRAHRHALFVPLAPVALPRAPDGAPLFFVAIGGVR